MAAGRPGGGIQRGPGRRQFLLGAGLAAVGGPAFLASCTRDPGGSGGAAPTGGLKLASPQNPVTWPISPGNEPIADGLPPEKNATLEVYNYADYVEPAVVASFEAKYKCKVNITTYNDQNEALTKIRQGSVPFDVWMGTGYDLISRLVTGTVIRPLNHSYIPNISNLWPVFTNPWYDQKWQYTVPFTVYTSGVGWRTDMMKSDPETLDTPWDTLWDPQYKGVTAVWDDFRSTIQMCLLRSGVTDVNTGAAADLDKARAALTELGRTTQPFVTITMYEDFPAGKFAQCSIWSGDIVNAAFEGDDPSVYRYWFGEGGKGLVDNDLLVLTKAGKNPVLAHLFLNHMLDADNALKNFSFMGYQPPQVSVIPDAMVEQEMIPANLASVVVRESDFTNGYPSLELTPETSAAWNDMWLAFKAGK